MLIDWETYKVVWLVAVNFYECIVSVVSRRYDIMSGTNLKYKVFNASAVTYKNIYKVIENGS